MHGPGPLPATVHTQGPSGVPRYNDGEPAFGIRAVGAWRTDQSNLGANLSGASPLNKVIYASETTIGCCHSMCVSVGAYTIVVVLVGAPGPAMLTKNPGMRTLTCPTT